MQGPGLATQSPLAAHAWHCPSHGLLAGLLQPVACNGEARAQAQGLESGSRKRTAVGGGCREEGGGSRPRRHALHMHPMLLCR